VALDKGAFVGRQALLAQRTRGIGLTLIGLEMVDRGVPRTGYPITARGDQVGYVTSGSYAPTLDRHIAMGYVPPALARPGTAIGVDIRGREAGARIVGLPFYRRNKEG
jgi:aminomethyltransferase